MDFLKGLLGGGGGTNSNGRREYEKAKDAIRQAEEFSRRCRAGDRDGAMKIAEQLAKQFKGGK